MTTANASPLAHVFHREIERFVETTVRTGANSLYQNRRRASRHHRECPLLIAKLGNITKTDAAATLYDISTDGLGFLSDAGYPVGTLIGIKLFWSDTAATRVPAIVRHCEIHVEGFLIGAEFVFDDPDACSLIERAETAWYG